MASQKQLIDNESIQNQVQEPELSPAEPGMVQGDITSGDPGMVQGDITSSDPGNTPNAPQNNDAPNGNLQQNRRSQKKAKRSHPLKEFARTIASTRDIYVAEQYNKVEEARKEATRFGIWEQKYQQLSISPHRPGVQITFSHISIDEEKDDSKGYELQLLDGVDLNQEKTDKTKAIKIGDIIEKTGRPSPRKFSSALISVWKQVKGEKVCLYKIKIPQPITVDEFVGKEEKARSEKFLYQDDDGRIFFFHQNENGPKEMAFIEFIIN